jgi:flagellar biosynthesis/type III secretory pathway M-ring protein FliF/YscJ
MIDIVKNKVMGIWNGLTVKKKIIAGVIAVVIVIAIVS